MPFPHRILFLGLALAFWPALCAQTGNSEPAAPLNMVSGARAQRELVVGVYASNFPYSYREKPGGPLTGFAVELLDELAETMNLKVRRMELPNDEVQVRFRAGEFDMLQMLSESKGRESWADFSVPLLSVQNVLFVRRDDRGVRSLADLLGRRFVVTGVGSTSELFLRAWDMDVRVQFTPSAEETLRTIERREADAVLMSRLTALSLIDHLKLTNLVELDDPAAYLEIRHCFAVHKGDTLLLARLNEGLAILHRTGEYDRIYRKWFGQYEPARFTGEELTRYVAGALALALLATLWGLVRQRTLHRRIARQTQELAEKEGLLRALYDNVPTAMCVFEVEPAGPRLLSINRRAVHLLGFTGESVIGQRLADLPLSPDWGTQLAGMLGRWTGGADIVTQEHLLATAQRHVVFTLVPLAGAAGVTPRLCLLLEDVTSRRQIDEEIAKSRRLRAVGELVGGIAHEFNNLMTPVLLKAGEIEALQIPNPLLQEDVGVIATAARRAAELTRRLLTFGRKGGSQREEVLLQAIVTDAFDLLRSTCDRRIVWERAVPDGLPPLYFNATDLNQILVNLLLNARDTLLDKMVGADLDHWTPRIRVTGVQLPLDTAGVPRAVAGGTPVGWQRLAVSDNGQGMPADVRERIFEPFFTTKDVGRGTGLGLATVWHLVSAAGGRIDVETKPDEGSTFHVLLPVWPVPRHARAERAPPVPAPNGTARVLVVDDDELVSRAMVTMLKRDGHPVRCMADGTVAWQHLQESHRDYELLVLDINLPGLDGLELVRRLRRSGFGGRILVVSGRIIPSDPAAAPETRIDRLLAKPFGIQEFRTAVSECLAPGKPGR